MKYRILEFPASNRASVYQAQYKFLNLFWLNCEDSSEDHWGLPNSCDISNVEWFIESKIASKKSAKVVKIYES